MPVWKRKEIQEVLRCNDLNAAKVRHELANTRRLKDRFAGLNKVGNWPTTLVVEASTKLMFNMN